MFVLKGLIRESEMGWGVDRKGSRAIRVQKVTTLDHEVFDLQGFR